jgi:hypothetical protein
MWDKILGTHVFKQKVLNFCENSHMGNIQISGMLHIYCIYIYCIKENVLDRIITLETDLEGLGNLRCFFPMNPTP